MKLRHRCFFLPLKLFLLDLHMIKLENELRRTVVSVRRQAQLARQLTNNRQSCSQICFHCVEDLALLNLHLHVQLRNVPVRCFYSLLDVPTIES